MNYNDIRYKGLRAEMARHKHTQNTLSGLLGVPQSGISKRLQGFVVWRKNEIDKICQFYGKSYEELFK